MARGPRTALVTGAEGFVGAYLVESLTRAGCAVTGVGRAASTPGPFAAWHQLDVRDRQALSEVVAAAKPEAVIHLAGITHLPRVLEAPTEAFDVNVGGTRNLLEAVRVSAPLARVLLVSSAAVYGSPPPEQLPLDEDAPLLSEHPYGVQKIAVECLGDRYREDHGLEVVIVRPFNHLGPRQEARFAAASFADKIAAIEAGLAPPVMRVGNLEPRRDILDVRDVVRAYLLLLAADRFAGTFVVARGRSTRVGDILDEFLRRARCPITVESDPALFRPHDAPDLVGSSARLTALTGWKPEIPLEETLGEILDEARERARALPKGGSAS